MDVVNLFVPGRVSIIGELSDIVTDYMSINDSIIPGEVIAGGIDKGIYATATLSNDFIFEFDNRSLFVKNMNLTKLSREAKSNSFFSYVAAVAYCMKRKYNVSGVNIRVRYMNLPIQKGLSSSASVCVLVVKAFNYLYNLNLNYMDIMELAYQAERYALSMCGRLDQICANGLCLSHMIFYEDSLDINKLDIKKELNFVIADLNGFKDTKKILSAYHSCFPFPKNDKEENVRKALCENNKYLVRESIEAIKNGDLEYLGKLLVNAQENIDNSGGKVTDALEGPLLHKVMSDKIIKKYSFGSKGTGSNGDGSIIILAKDKNSQKEITKYLYDQYEMNSFEFNVRNTCSIKKTVINIKDVNFDNSNFCSLVLELDEVGIDDILLIGNTYIIDKCKNILNKIYSDLEFDNLSEGDKEYQINLYRINEKINYVVSDFIDNNTINEFSENDGFIYICSIESIKDILNIFENDNSYLLLEDIEFLNEITENTIIKIKK